MAASQKSVEALLAAARAAEEKQGTELFAVDTSDSMGLIDGFLLVSAHNERLVNAIVDAVEEALQLEFAWRPLRREGRAGGRWVLLDFADIVVHVQHAEDMAFYALDRLWADSPRIVLGLEHEAALVKDVDHRADERMIRAVDEPGSEKS